MVAINQVFFCARFSLSSCHVSCVKVAAASLELKPLSIELKPTSSLALNEQHFLLRRRFFHQTDRRLLLGLAPSSVARVEWCGRVTADSPSSSCLRTATAGGAHPAVDLSQC